MSDVPSTRSMESSIDFRKVGLILIGDELLSGTREDKHMSAVIALLKARGMSLAWVRVIGDTRQEIIETLKQTQVLPELVFSFGGIGATPDDQTRAASAEAFGRELILHPEAEALLVEKFGDQVYPHRILMAEIAEDAELIPNPINQVPGFKLEDHHFVPGFPNMAWPMVEWVLDTHYADLFNDSPDVEWRWDVFDVAESQLLNMMNDMLESFNVGISSLPCTDRRSHLIDYGIKGPESDVAKAAQWMTKYFDEQNIQYQYQGTVSAS